MSKIITCPFCGSTDVIRQEENIYKQLTLGPEFKVIETTYKCNLCGEEGDFASENDKEYMTALKVAEKESMKSMLSYLNEQNISMAYFERVFELPARTLTRWKNGDFSASALALVRTIRTFPWISEVAENRFDYNFAGKMMLKKSWSIISEMVDSQKDLSLDINVSTNSISSVIQATFIKKRLGDPCFDNQEANYALGG